AADAAVTSEQADRLGKDLTPSGAERAGNQEGSIPAYEGGEAPRSEEHTSELQSRENLVCRLLLEKKKKTNNHTVERSLEGHYTLSTLTTASTATPKFFFFFSALGPPPRPPLFPYTTLFRSCGGCRSNAGAGRSPGQGPDDDRRRTGRQPGRHDPGVRGRGSAFAGVELGQGAIAVLEIQGRAAALLDRRLQRRPLRRAPDRSADHRPEDRAGLPDGYLPVASHVRH